MEIFDLSRSHLLKLLSIIVLSDGYIHKKEEKPTSIRLAVIPQNIEQIDLFESICLKLFGKKNKRYNVRSVDKNNKEKNLILSEAFIRERIKELYLLSPTFKTSPGPIEKSIFLNSEQPTLKFLDKEPETLKWLGLRMYFDFDGSIIARFKLKNKKDRKGDKIYQYYQVQFECEIKLAETNPNLNTELIKICKELGLRANRKKDERKWSGIDGVSISELKSVLIFIEKGGAITNVKISSKSRQLEGIKKNDVCNAVEIILRNKKFPLSRYFKDYYSAIKFKNDLNSQLMDLIKNSPMV